MKPVRAVMPCCTGGQTKQAPKPRAAASAATQVKDQRVPEKMPGRMPLWVTSQVRLKMPPTARPSKMPPNTPVSTVWMPSTVVWPELYSPVRASGWASCPSAVRVTLPAVR